VSVCLCVCVCGRECSFVHGVTVPDEDGRNEVLPESMQWNSTREIAGQRAERTVEGEKSEQGLKVGLRRGQGALGRLLASS